MFLPVRQTLGANLIQGGQLTIPGDFDEFRAAASGHLVLNRTTDMRYVAPTDFTLSFDGDGNVVLTWLNATTQNSGADLYIGIAYIDVIIGGASASDLGGVGAGDASEATLQAINTNITGERADITARLGTLGRKAANASSPFVLSNEDKAVLDSLDTKLTPISTAAHQVTLNTATGAPADVVAPADNSNVGIIPLLKRIATNITNFSAKFGAIGQQNVAGSTSFTLASNDTLRDQVGATNEASAAADNSVAGLNGLTKRLLARLTVLIGLFPATFGRKSAATSFSTTISTEDLQALVDINTNITGLRADINTEPPDVPIEKAASTSDALEHKNSASSIGSAQLIAGVAGQTIRIHEFFMVSLTGAGIIRFRDGGAGGTILREFRFKNIDGGCWDKPWRSRPYVVTTAGNALWWERTTADAADVEFDYIQAA